MARGIATPKQTSGSGFTFEVKVCASILSQMLADQPPLSADLGTLVRVDFQTRVDGWFFDDVQMTLRSDGGDRACAASIKSNSQFSRTGEAPSDFVRDAWEQFLHVGTDKFDPQRDLLCLITGPIDTTLRSAIHGVLRKTAGAHLAERFVQPGWANDTERELFRSFACPDDIAAERDVSEGDIALLLSRVRVLHVDFDDVASESERVVLERCRGQLRVGSIDDARKLWNELNAIASELRPAAGRITRSGLVERLRYKFPLKGLATHNEDWSRLSTLAHTGAEAVPNTLGQRVRIDRTSTVREVVEALDSASVFLTGDSGVGKSAVARHVAEEMLGSPLPCIWLNAMVFEHQDFSAIQNSLGLAHPLSELAGSVSAPRAYVFLEGLDKLYGPRVFSAVKQLLSTLTVGRVDSPWRALLTCQSPELARIQATLFQSGVDTTKWKLHELAPIEAEQLRPLWEKIPKLKPVRFNEKLRPLLSNLKVVDLIATQAVVGSGELPASDWVGETSVSSWYWRSVVSQGPSGSARSRLAMAVAEKQADRLIATVPTTDFSPPEMEYLHELQVQRVCAVQDEQIAFEHDLFGDWARLRSIMARANYAAHYIPTKLDSPLWHRAIRLFGTHLLEKRDNLVSWRRAFAGLVNHQLAQDLLLESALFATSSRGLLDALHGDLMADDGKLLVRLLSRCLVSGTLPDPFWLAAAKQLGMRQSEAAQWFRYPRWQHWLPLISFIHKNARSCVRLAPVETGRVVELTMKHAPAGHGVRLQGARLGIQLGDAALAARNEYGEPSEDERTLLYKVALSGAAELPDEVEDFVLSASSRSGAPRPLQKRPPRQGLHAVLTYGEEDELPPPWPGGPHSRVDDEFRKAVLSDGLVPLMQEKPDVAREVALACLISERSYSEQRDYQNIGGEVGLEEAVWLHPPLHTKGPFLRFLQEDFAQGFTLIDRLVTFAYERRLDRDYSLSLRKGHGNLCVEHFVTLPLSSGTRTIRGGIECFGWSSGNRAPRAAEVALMALEAYFYQQLDREEPIADLLAQVLAGSQTVATVAVVCDVGKKSPDHFKGVLLPLLGIPEIYEWSLQVNLHGRSHMMLGLFDEFVVHAARQFHNQEHRAVDLRRVAATLLFESEAVQEFLSVARSQWEQDLATLPSYERDARERLCLWFDIDNYVRYEHPEHGWVVVNRALHELQEKEAPQAAVHEQRLRVLTFPIQCRRILDGEEEITPAELWEWWSFLEQCAAGTKQEPELREEQEPHSDEFEPELARKDVAACIAGWAAVASRVDFDRLQSEQTCLDSIIDDLVAMVRSPLPRLWFDSELSACNWTWDVFAAEALTRLLSGTPNDVRLREAVARLCFSKPYVVVRVLMSCLYDEQELRRDFHRLRHLLMRWAHLRDRARSCERVVLRQHRPNEEVAAATLERIGLEAESLIDGFVTGALPSECGEWSSLDYADVFADFDRQVPVPPGHTRIDIETVVAGHAWMTAAANATDETERTQWPIFWREALQYLLRRVRSNADKRPGLPEAFRWILEGAGSQLVWMSDAEKPEELWKPVLKLSRSYGYWVEVFLSGFHRARLGSQTYSPTAALRLESMFDFALTQQPAWSSERNAWASLLGLNQITQYRWQPHHADIATPMAGVLEAWTGAERTRWGGIECLAVWLVRKCAEPLVLPALSWVVSATQRLTARDFLRERAMESIASLVQHVWTQRAEDLRPNPNGMQAFRALLRWLVEEQHPTGLALANEIGGF